MPDTGAEHTSPCEPVFRNALQPVSLQNPISRLQLFVLCAEIAVVVSGNHHDIYGEVAQSSANSRHNRPNQTSCSVVLLGLAAVRDVAGDGDEAGRDVVPAQPGADRLRNKSGRCVVPKHGVLPICSNVDVAEMHDGNLQAGKVPPPP